jgi:hypothetical protein
MYQRLSLIFFALTAFLLAACSPEINLLDENNLKDTSLVSGEPCDAPCWNNITPGETTYRDALISVEDDGRFQNVQENEFDEETDERLFGFSDGDANICCQVYSRDGEVVDSMLFLLAPQMTLGEVVDKYGEPTYLTGEEVAEGQAIVFLVYPDVPIVLYAYVAGAAGDLTETSEIIGALYMTESEIQQIIDASQFYEWEGYQAFADYIDENYDFIGVDAVVDEANPDEAEATATD